MDLGLKTIRTTHPPSYAAHTDPAIRHEEETFSPLVLFFALVIVPPSAAVETGLSELVRGVGPSRPTVSQSGCSPVAVVHYMQVCCMHGRDQPVLGPPA